MAKNTKKTSAKVATTASKMLRRKSLSSAEKSVPASAMAQRKTEKETGAKVEPKASKAMRKGASAKDRAVGASVVSQANKKRGS